jgi:hypothetical protein
MVLMLLSMLIWQQPHQQLTVAALSRALAWLTSTTGAARCVVTASYYRRVLCSVAIAVYCLVVCTRSSTHACMCAVLVVKMGSHAVDAFGHFVFATVLVVVAAAIGVSTVKLLCCADNSTDSSISFSVLPANFYYICHQRALA